MIPYNRIMIGLLKNADETKSKPEDDGCWNSTSLILCSTSVRTMETMHWLTGEWRITPERRIHQELYHADARQIFRHVYHLPERFSVVLMVGHNPGFEQFVSLFSEKQEVLPTTSLALLEFDVCNWSELTEKSRLKTIAVFRHRELS